MYVVWNRQKCKWLRGATYWMWSNSWHHSARHDGPEVFRMMHNGTVGYEWQEKLKDCDLIHVVDGRLLTVDWDDTDTNSIG